MEPTALNQPIRPLGATETQIFPGGSGLTPDQKQLLQRNLEQSRKSREMSAPVQVEVMPEYANYIFTKNYILFSSLLIVLAFVVFGIIIYIQLTRYVVS